MKPQTSLIDARKSEDFREDEGGRWVTYCDLHGSFVQHATRSLARDFLAHPGEWCEACQHADSDDDAPDDANPDQGDTVTLYAEIVVREYGEPESTKIIGPFDLGGYDDPADVLENNLRTQGDDVTRIIRPGDTDHPGDYNRLD